MKIALIIENSQAAKSEAIHTALRNIAEPLGHEVHHKRFFDWDPPGQWHQDLG